MIIKRMSVRKALELGGDKNVIIFCEQLIHLKRICLLPHSFCSLPACFQMAAGSHPCPGGLQVSQLWACQPFLLHVGPGEYVASPCLCPLQLWEDQVWCISSWLLLINAFLRHRIQRCSLRVRVGFLGSGVSGVVLLAWGSLVRLAGTCSTLGHMVFGPGWDMSADRSQKLQCLRQEEEWALLVSARLPWCSAPVQERGRALLSDITGERGWEWGTLLHRCTGKWEWILSR